MRYVFKLHIILFSNLVKVRSLFGCLVADIASYSAKL